MGVIKKENLIGLMTDLLGVPYHILKTQEELQAEQSQAQQQQMIEQLTQAAPAMGSAVKDTGAGLQSLAQTAQIGLGGQGNIS
jgi:ribosomal protein S12